jgi:hypothetical protein
LNQLSIKKGGLERAINIFLEADSSEVLSAASGDPRQVYSQNDTLAQGSFFRRQNTEGLTLVVLFMEGTTLTCLETYSDAKKRTLPWLVVTLFYFTTILVGKV